MRAFLLCAAAALALAGCKPIVSEAEAAPSPRSIRALLNEELSGARPPSAFALQMLQTGEPTLVGVLQSGAGANVNNSTTATPFTLAVATNGTRLYLMDCDAAGNPGVGATCATVITGANYQPLVPVHTLRYFLLQDATTNLCTAGAAAINCAVFQMR